MLAIWVGKIVERLLLLMGRRATSLPGKIALRLSRHLLAKLGRQLERCVIVTGTNGKTTTSSLLSEILKTEGPIISNAEGANMEQGLVSALLHHCGWFGRLKSKTAVLEIDEATLPLVASSLPIKIAVVTNVFRDQLDRYGELDSTMDKLLEGLRATTATVVLNGDDPLARHIGLHCGNPTLYFSLDKSHAQTSVRDQIRDGGFCLECGAPLQYDAFFYGQLGLYKCPNEDFFRPHPDFSGRFDGERLLIQEEGQPEASFMVPVRGVFNLYNLLAAIAAARAFGLSREQINTGLTRFQAPLGRMQVFQTTPVSILNLIKNPTGCDSVLQAIVQEPREKVLCIAINDLAADGRDVSWLWDADFELIAENETDFAACIVTGLRAEDMAIRLKYAGYPTERIRVAPNLETGLAQGFEEAEQFGNLQLYVVTTYTALYPAANYLSRRPLAREQSAQDCASVS